MRRRIAVAVIFLAVVLEAPRRARAGGANDLAEPTIEDNITDIDAEEVGGVEADATATVLHPRAGGPGVWSSSIAAEWRALDRFGVGADLAMGGALAGARPSEPELLTVRGALSYVLVRDPVDRFYLQAETGARFETGEEGGFVDPTEPDLPYTAGLRAAFGLGDFTFRAATFGEAGARARAHVRWTSAALYGLGLGFDDARLYLGAESIADYARTAPYLVAPQALVLGSLFGRGVRFGVAVPTSLGAKGAESSWGIVLRLVLEAS